MLHRCDLLCSSVYVTSVWRVLMCVLRADSGCETLDVREAGYWGMQDVNGDGYEKSSIWEMLDAYTRLPGTPRLADSWVRREREDFGSDLGLCCSLGPVPFELPRESSFCTGESPGQRHRRASPRRTTGRHRSASPECITGIRIVVGSIVDVRIFNPADSIRWFFKL